MHPIVQAQSLGQGRWQLLSVYGALAVSVSESIRHPICTASEPVSVLK